MTERTSGVVAQVVLATSCKKQRNKEGQGALSLCVCCPILLGVRFCLCLTCYSRGFVQWDWID